MNIRVVLAAFFILTVVTGSTAFGLAWRLEAQTPPALELYGVIGNHLVTIDQVTGDATDVGAMGNFSGVTGLTYNPNTDSLFAIADSVGDPKLITIDRATGQAATIGSILLVGPADLPGVPLDVQLAESMAFNPTDGLLYAAVSEDDVVGGFVGTSSFRLATIDPASAEATQAALITGSIFVPPALKSDADAMVFVSGTLYATDCSFCTLHTIDHSTGQATPVTNDSGLLGFDGVADLAFNPETGILFGTSTIERALITISRTTGEGTLIGTTHTADEFDGRLMAAIAIAPPLHSEPQPPDSGPILNAIAGLQQQLEDLLGQSKAEILGALNGAVQTLDQAVNAARDSILDELNDPQHGLAEIKSAVGAIEQNLDDPESGLAAIRDEAAHIERKVLEDALVRGDLYPMLATPADVDPQGRLEEVLAVVGRSIANFEAMGLDTKDAQQDFADCQSRHAAGEFVKAVEHCSDAMQELIDDNDSGDEGQHKNRRNQNRDNASDKDNS